MAQTATVDRSPAELFSRRTAPTRSLGEHAGDVARACRDIAERFRRGGRLLVFAAGGAATDAQHIAVEFTHPVIVGKRALPALALTNDWPTLSGIIAEDGFAECFAHQLRLLARPDDIALGLSPDGTCPAVLAGLRTAAGSGLLTVAMVGGDGGPIVTDAQIDHVLTADSDDPRVVKEVQVTTYHILWELAHVFLERSSGTGRGDQRGAA
jgi:D-sedoheptulose 7-phosphate isomerase